MVFCLLILWPRNNLNSIVGKGQIQNVYCQTIRNLLRAIKKWHTGKGNFTQLRQVTYWTPFAGMFKPFTLTGYDLVPSDFHLFFHHNFYLSSQLYDNDEMKTAVNTSLSDEMATFYEECTTLTAYKGKHNL